MNDAATKKACRDAILDLALTELGQTAGPYLKLNRQFESAPEELTSAWERIAEIEIGPGDVGLFGPAIKTMTIQVSAAIAENGDELNGYLEYEYRYEHSNNGGRNGFQVRTRLEFREGRWQKEITA